MLVSLKRLWFRLLCPVVFLVVLAAPVLSADPVINAPATVPVYNLVTISTPTAANSYHWLVIGVGPVNYRALGNGSEIIWTGPPGNYLVVLVVVNANGTKDTNKATVVIGDAPNPPDPGPGPLPPDPDPPIPPVDPKWQITLFHNSNDLDNYTQEQLAMLQGLKFRKALVEEGHNFIGSYDIQSPLVKERATTNLAQWFAAVKGKTMPVVALAPKDGGAIQVFPLTTKVNFTSLLKTTKQEPKR